MTLTTSLAVGPDEPPIRDITIGDLLREAAAQVPDRVALIEAAREPDARREWTYEALLAESERVARALLTRFDPGDHIAVWAPNIPEWVLLEFGVALAGMVLVTVNPAYQPEEVTYVLAQSRTKGLLCSDTYRGNAMLATAHDVQPDCPELREIICFSEWEEFLASGDNFGGSLPEVSPLDPVMIQYTSGTTGFPKGALLHHRGLVNNANHGFALMGLGEGDVYVATMPMFHTTGSACGVLGCASYRCTQVLVETFEPGLVLEVLETYGAHGIIAVPTMLIGILEHEALGQTDLTALKCVTSGGSLVPEHLVRTFETQLGAPFVIVYGQTECSPLATMTTPQDTLEDKSSTIGPPVPHVEIKIVDPDTGATMPVGGVGELCTRGYHVMHHYFEMPEQTAETIDSDGWLHTGDLAAMDDRGYLNIEGRLKDMIIRGGENIYPKELEDLLFGHDSVAEVAVVGLPDDRWGETVGAFVRPAPGSTVDKSELFAYLREHLSPQKTPKQWFEVDEFPLTGSGKIQKFKLRDQWVAGQWDEL